MRGRTAREIAAGVEGAIRGGQLRPGDGLPTVRIAATTLGVSPVTVSAAYRVLKSRGFVIADGRRGTRIAHAPALTLRRSAAPPEGVRNLSEGNPDPELLPSLDAALLAVDPAPTLYGDYANLPELLEVARDQLGADGVEVESLAVVGGAADGMERVLLSHLLPGDAVAIEDPAFTRTIDLLGALGLIAHPVGMDDLGMLPGALDRALASGAEAAIITPRAQNPTGAALDEVRAAELREVLDDHPGALVIEDDHAGPVAGMRVFTLCEGRERWATLRSVSKFLGPDLRVALLAGDPATVARVDGRQRIGTGWVSHVLQRMVAHLWNDPATAELFARAASTYANRRRALGDALAEYGIPARSRSGLNAWIEVDEETYVVRGLLHAGWAVAPGERFRVESHPAIRVTVASLKESEVDEFAADLARVLRPAARTYLA